VVAHSSNAAEASWPSSPHRREARGRSPARRKARPRGSLSVVGTGIQAARHATAETRAAIAAAEKVFFLVTDPMSERWVRRLNRTAESLQGCYVVGEPRVRAYLRMVDRMMGAVRAGKDVCAAFYGHPGVFVYPSHEAIRRARRDGYPARMLPAVSAEDCLFADLGIDPSRSGCQSFEATDFLVYRRKFDPTSSLILWQAGLVGRLEYRQRYGGAALRKLARYLERFYGPRHEVVLYQASEFPIFGPTIRSTTIADLSSADVPSLTTLYIPPRPERPDRRVLRGLGLSLRNLHVVPPCWEPRR
jgi:hypothetical protein